MVLDGTVSGSTLICRVREFSVTSEGVALSVASPAGVRDLVVDVSGAAPSRVSGRLIAPKLPGVRFWLVNPNGIEIDETARIELPGDVVFATASGVLRETASGAPSGLRFSRNATGGVTNSGVVNAVPGTSVFLIGATIGQHGAITAPGGEVNLAAVVPTGTFRSRTNPA